MSTQLVHNSGPGHASMVWEQAVVLVIDDDEHFRAIARAVLEQEGISVLEAGGVRQGLHWMRTVPVDIVILDLVMPDEDGITGLRRIKGAHSEVKVIAMSGARAWEPYLRASALLGADATLPKSHVEQLCPLLDQLLRSNGNRPPEAS